MKHLDTTGCEFHHGSEEEENSSCADVNDGRTVGRRPPTNSGTCHHLAAASHVGGAEGARLARLLTQRARLAKPVQQAVEDRRSFDVLRLADVGAYAALAEQADAGTADVQQRVAAARATGRLSHLPGRVARTEEGNDAHRTVAETAAEIVLERRHRVCAHTPTMSILPSKYGLTLTRTTTGAYWATTLL